MSNIALKTQPMTNLSEQQIAQHIKDIEVLGYTRLPGFLAPETLAATRDRLAEIVEEMRGSVYPGYTEHRPDDEIVFNLQNKDKIFIDLLGDPAMERILMRFVNDEHYNMLPPDLPNYVLNEYVARVSETHLPMHIDCWMPAPGHRTWMMHVAIAMHDRDEADGCTFLVPGSHHSGDYTERMFPNTTLAPVTAGDVLVWDGRLWHGAGARQSENKSWILIATLQRWWVKQRSDMPRSLPEDIYDSLTDRQRALLGFISVPPTSELDYVETRGGYETIERNRKATRR